MIYKEQLDSLIQDLEENGASGPDAEQAVENCLKFLKQLQAKSIHVDDIGPCY